MPQLMKVQRQKKKLFLEARASLELALKKWSPGASIHKTCWDQIFSQVSSFGLKSETVFGLRLVAIHKIVETKFSLRFGLKLEIST